MRAMGRTLSMGLVVAATMTYSGGWQTAIATTPEDIPKLTGAFLAFCAESSEKFVQCSEEIQWVDISINMGLFDKFGYKRSCPGGFVPGPKFATYVTDWLSAHPEMFEQERTKSIGAAIAALYPCPS